MCRFYLCGLSRDRNSAEELPTIKGHWGEVRWGEAGVGFGGARCCRRRGGPGAFSTTCQSSDKETKGQSAVFSGNSQIRWQHWERYHYNGHHWPSLPNRDCLQLKRKSASVNMCCVDIIFTPTQLVCSNSVTGWDKWSRYCYTVYCM